MIMAFSSLSWLRLANVGPNIGCVLTNGCPHESYQSFNPVLTDEISLRMQSAGRNGKISSNAEIVNFTVTAFITNSGQNSFISSWVVNLWQLYVNLSLFASFSNTATSWSKLSRSVKKLPIFPAPNISILIT